MIDLSKIFESIEKLTYDILIWILLVPKTLLKILIKPSWVPGYVTDELKQEEDQKFDDYLSPVILILISALLPYLYSSITPYPGVTVDTSARLTESGYYEAELGTLTRFWAVPDFIAETDNYTYAWDTPGGDILLNDGDYLSLSWDRNGVYDVTVTVQNDQGEVYKRTSIIYVLPEGESVSEVLSRNVVSASENDQAGPLKQLQSEGMIVPALIFLSLPMLFAIATEAFRGHALMRSTLRRSYYIQCYYLSPFIFIMWSSYLEFSYFITPKEEWITGVVSAVFAGTLVWLFWNELELIYIERGLKSRWAAAGIITFCIGLIIAVALFALLADSELLRKALEWFYLLAVAGIYLAAIRTPRKKTEITDGSNGNRVAVSPSNKNLARHSSRSGSLKRRHPLK